MIDRRTEVPAEGAYCDLLWSDPEEIETWAKSERGAGWLFGSKVVAQVSTEIDQAQFNHLNDLALICRSHQLAQEGFNFMFNRSLVTVWSAPNYCYR